jgi:hypothetical protein
MHVRSVRSVQFLACLSLFMVTLSAFAAKVTGPVVVLPNSYYLQPDQGGQTKLVKHDGSRVLPGTIAAYIVSGQIVVGALGQTPAYSHDYSNDLEFTGKPETRYFILDTASGKLETDLEEAAWKKRLQELGLSADLHIYPPLAWQQ